MSSSPPIGEYAYIADCHSAALVSRAGSIDWCCMPRMDSPSCFGRLLDWEKGGYFQVAPVSPWTCTRRYLGNSLILETTFQTQEGVLRLTDFLPMRKGGEYEPYQQILRLLDGLEGEVPVTIDIVPRFDYGAIRPWIRRAGSGRFVAVGGADGLVFSTDIPLEMGDRHCLGGRVKVRKDQRLCLSTLYRLPELLDEGPEDVPGPEVMVRRLEETVAWWRRWGRNLKPRGPYAAQAARSAVVLKGLTNAPTGAVAAAPTTSLPESPGGTRNWDYRYSWIRDSCFSVRALAEVGLHREADGFRRFIERSAAGSAEELQIVFGLGGERRLYEYEIPELEGYGGARPVRIGNGAVSQLQLDVYGELLDLAWIWHQWGQSYDDDYWEFLVQTVELAGRIWEQPDRGIWEIRGEPRHFVHSKAMCWVALDRGIRLAEETRRQAPLERWKQLRGRIREVVDREGYDRERGVYVQAFGSSAMDAALLLLPVFGYVAFDDERMVRTTDVVRRELDSGGLLLRYSGESDGLQGREGTFLACTFWLAECLAHQGRRQEAESVFLRALSTGNDLGLFAEEFEPESRQLLGNFPQGLTHLSLILAAMALSEREAGYKQKVGPEDR
jgi:GH15 family glucan-1,4-alpha-glucosidase